MTGINSMKTLSVLAAFFLASVSARADVTLNGIFDDHMVLQRGIPVSVYGTADPEEKVTVAFAGQTKSATADKDGAWCVKLDAMKACALSAVMTVSGKNKLSLKDVVVGDVWVCSGQSNMDFTPAPTAAPMIPSPMMRKTSIFRCCVSSIWSMIRRCTPKSTLKSIEVTGLRKRMPHGFRASRQRATGSRP